MKQDNYFNVWTKEISCSDKYTCLHEHGHLLDFQLGWESKGKAFQESVQVFNRVQWLLDPDDRHEWAERMHEFPGVTAPKTPCKDLLSMSFWTGGWGGYTELYAEMYAWANGDISNMPHEFRKYYAPETYTGIDKEK